MLQDVGLTVQSPSYLIQVLETLPAAAYLCDPDGLITFCNRNAVEVWGRAPRINDPVDRYCGSYKLFFADGTPMRHDQSWMARALRERTSFNGQELTIQQPGGGLRSALAHANPMFDEDGRFLGASNVLVDITDRKRAEDRLSYQATYDALTGLPNRQLLLGTLERAIAAEGSGGRPFALLLLDLDRFKAINDTFGHEFGDEVLCQLKPRLLGVVREGDLVARLGGDEFGVVLPGVDRSRAFRVAEALLAAVARPILVGGRTFEVDASVGVALYPEHGQDPATLLRHADVAMYAAKRTQAGAVLYADHQDSTTPLQFSMAVDLRRAIEHEELTLHYQPKVDLLTRKVVGVEALVRWPHPHRGLISPGHFLPMVEAHGLSRRLDQWVLREAIRQGREWRRDGLDLDIAVNLFAESLLDDGFVETALGLLDEAAGPPVNLTVELSERAVVSEPGRVRSALDRFRARGTRAALDDFGTGYSSLAHLKLLKVDEVKLDLSFVRELPGSVTDAFIAEAVLNLGANLGLVVTAEGVERPETLEWLADRGCGQSQGFYHSAAMPPGTLPAWISARSFSMASQAV